MSSTPCPPATRPHYHVSWVTKCVIPSSARGLPERQPLTWLLDGRCVLSYIEATPHRLSSRLSGSLENVDITGSHSLFIGY